MQSANTHTHTSCTSTVCCSCHSAGLLATGATLGHLNWVAIQGAAGLKEEESKTADTEGERNNSQGEQEEKGSTAASPTTRGQAAFNCVLYGLPHICLVPPES